jgi:tetratricopeptide (TPR) repeat protein
MLPAPPTGGGSSVSSRLFNDLQADLSAGHVLVIVGAGVSIASTAGTPGQRFASWNGLVANGIERCTELALSLPEGWADRLRADLRSQDLDSLLIVAEHIGSKLGAPESGEYARWLRETVGTLRAKDPSIVSALSELGCVLATTNYDSLLEDATGQSPVTWRAGNLVERVVNRVDPGIIHLHGHWREPASVVLGIRDYERVLGDPHAQTVLHALRMMRTILFVGFGSGLQDPNFGAFLRWTRGVFAGSEGRHYRLCREQEVAELQALHPPAERLFPLAYGRDHADLAPFLRRLQPAHTASDEAGSIAAAAPAFAQRLSPRIPGRPRCFGRDDQIDELVTGLLSKPLLPVLILGPPGVGKTNLALTALHHPRVIEVFGPRRFFASCDGVTSHEGVIAACAKAVGLELAPSLADRLFRHLEAAPPLLVLDNAETPWETDPPGVDDLFVQLASLDGLALVVSLRGEQRPAGPTWREPLRLRPLDLAAARSAFLSIAGERHRSDPLLDRLIEAVDRLPLALTLLGFEAEAAHDLADVWQLWQTERISLLRLRGGTTRLTSVEVSVALSLKSPRLTSSSRRLASLLALLPEGLAAADLRDLLPADGPQGASDLRKIGLILPEDSRLRLLAPVREAVARLQPPAAEDREALVRHYFSLAQLAKSVGHEGGAKAARRLTPELLNFEAVLSVALQDPRPEAAIEAAISLTDFLRFSGLPSPVLALALDAALEMGSLLLQARCIDSIGLIALHRSDYPTARARFEEALAIFRRVEDPLGEANCILSLGDIAHRCSDHGTARTLYEEALPIFHRVGYPLGAANCIQSLGDIDLQRSDHEAASARYEQALAIFRPLGYVRGEANCILGLSEIALQRSDYETARTRYEEGLAIYRRIGSLRGEAHCILGLGEVALQGSEYETARACYEEALPLYRRIGSLLGEANCLRGFGDIAAVLGDEASAQELFEEALRLYEKIAEPDSIGWANLRLARLASTRPESRIQYLKAARSAWASISRTDLLSRLEDEFGAIPARPSD